MRGYMCERFDLEVHDLPPKYPVYCVYIPTGMKTPTENNVIETLEVWGKSMGANVSVSTWDVGHPNYRELMKTLGTKRKPMLIFTDTNKIASNSYIIALDDPVLMSNIEKLKTLLPHLADLIMTGEYAQAGKEALKNKRKSDLEKLIHKLGEVTKFNLTFSAFGASVSIDTK